MGNQIILIGLVVIAIGVMIKLGVPLGHLPGDISVKKGNFNFYFPLTTSILISLIVSIILKFFKS